MASLFLYSAFFFRDVVAAASAAGADMAALVAVAVEECPFT